MRIAVAGGTGWAGRLVVDAIGEAGHEAVVIARSQGVDLTTGQGLDAALAGVDVVVDTTNIVTTNRAKAEEFFAATTGRLLQAGQAAGVGHHVVLSIVNCDRVDLGYYYGKRRQEALVAAGPVPYSILRVTQFHEFAAQMLARGGPIVLAPRMLCRPIALTEVAQALLDLAVDRPAGLAPDLAGPEEQEMVSMIRRLHHARGGRRPVVPLRIPGAAGRAVAGGGLLPLGDATLGAQTFDAWVEEDAAARQEDAV
ncbi:SDR family oxidoreductase [Actinacidiphila acididurans]|uniref:3-beta hydroxysteroid dehydrogenase n=1 Tax=Actinacidiphila acididurans TaxID=2784346 RepID=A0ABS2TZE0_9ACTN|nr:NAD-dependent epimerase/dehydratase family protein [Actinacidiphila acididurans]MBM9508697.1 3-beta hydroxysteroid dehydrogenase [Actinacidiphila acididurans]